MTYIFDIRLTVGAYNNKTIRNIYIGLHIEISEVDHYTWIMRGYSLLESLDFRNNFFT